MGKGELQGGDRRLREAREVGTGLRKEMRWQLEGGRSEARGPKAEALLPSPSPAHGGSQAGTLGKVLSGQLLGREGSGIEGPTSQEAKGEGH